MRSDETTFAQKSCKYLVKLTSGEDIDLINDNTTKMKETLTNSNNGFTRLLEAVQSTAMYACCGGPITALCSYCKIVGYCGKNCQKKTLEKHA